jgi:hypothetical protein
MWMFDQDSVKFCWDLQWLSKKQKVEKESHHIHMVEYSLLPESKLWFF